MSSEPGSGNPDLAGALETLSELRAELASAPGLEAERRTHVLAEIDEIREQLERREFATASRIEQIAIDIETSHPLAADLLNRVSTMLANMGI